MKNIFWISIFLVSALTSLGQMSFKTQNISGSRFSRSMTIVDLNKDGKMDIASADDFSGSSLNNVSVLLNNGGGVFNALVNYSAGNTAVGIASGYINGDSLPDLAVTNIFGNNVSVLLNIGNGVFGVAVNYPVQGQPEGVALGDLNGDGKADIAVANSCLGCNNISILLNKGDGTFNSAVNYPTGNLSYSVAIADINGDQKNDVVCANEFGINTILVFLNKGDGTFTSAGTYESGGGAIYISTRDLNADGYIDIAVTNSEENNVGVLLNNGNGTFSNAVNYSVGNYPLGISIGDLNGDCAPDIAVANYNDNTISILLNDGYGNFGTLTNYSVGNYPWSIAIGDLNNDSLMDIAVGDFNDPNNYLTLFINTSTPRTCQNYNPNNMFIPNLVTLNQDGKNDTFKITELIPECTLKIYNRWGGLIYEKVNYDNSWPNEKVNSGIYYYDLSNTAARKSFKGWIQVIED